MRDAVFAFVGVLALAVPGLPPAAAAETSAATIVERMKAALEPPRTTVRRLVMTTTGDAGETVRWTAGQARKVRADGEWMLTALLAPADVRGTAFLVHEPRSGEGAKWLYSPAIRRVRKIVPVAGYLPFLESDFTYADLGLVDRRATYTLSGEESRDGVQTYRVEVVPQDRWFYSRIVTWVAKETNLPVRREFHDPADALWKVETIDDVATVDGVATPRRWRMEDVQNRTSSVMQLENVRYDVDVPDDVFVPASLAHVVEAGLWSGMVPP